MYWSGLGGWVKKRADTDVVLETIRGRTTQALGAVLVIALRFTGPESDQEAQLPAEPPPIRGVVVKAPPSDVPIRGQLSCTTGRARKGCRIRLTVFLLVIFTFCH